MSRHLTESPKASTATENLIDTWYQRFSQLSFSNTKVIKAFCYLVMNMNDEVSEDEEISRIVASLKLALHQGVPAVELLPLLAWFRLVNFMDYRIVENLKQQLEHHTDLNCQSLLKLARQHKFDNKNPQFYALGDVNLFGETNEQVVNSQQFSEALSAQHPENRLSPSSTFNPITINEALGEELRISYGTIVDYIDIYWEYFGSNILMVMDLTWHYSLTEYLISKIHQKTISYYTVFSYLNQTRIINISTVFLEFLLDLHGQNRLISAMQETPGLLVMSYLADGVSRYTQAIKTIYQNLTKDQLRQLINNNAFTGVKKLFLWSQFYISLKNFIAHTKTLESDDLERLGILLLLLRDSIIRLLLDIAQGPEVLLWPNSDGQHIDYDDITQGLLQLISQWNSEYQASQNFNSLYDLWVSHEADRTVMKKVYPSLRYREYPFTLNELIAFYFKGQFDSDPDHFNIETVWLQVALQHFPYLLPVESDTPDSLNTKSKELSGHFRKALVAAFESATETRYQEEIVAALERQMMAEQLMVNESTHPNYYFTEKVEWWTEKSWWDRHEHPINICILRDNEMGLAHLFAKNHAAITRKIIESAVNYKNNKVIAYLADPDRIKAMNIDVVILILRAVGQLKLWSCFSESYFNIILQCPAIRIGFDDIMEDPGKIDVFADLLNMATDDNVIEVVENIVSIPLFYLQDIRKAKLEILFIEAMRANNVGIARALLKFIGNLQPLNMTRIIGKYRDFGNSRLLGEAIKQNFHFLEVAMMQQLSEAGHVEILVNLKLDRRADNSEKFALLTDLLMQQDFNENAKLTILRYAIKTFYGDQLKQALTKIFTRFSFSDADLSLVVQGASDDKKTPLVRFFLKCQMNSVGLVPCEQWVDRNRIDALAIQMWISFLKDSDVFFYDRLGRLVCQTIPGKNSLRLVFAVYVGRWDVVNTLIEKDPGSLDIDIVNSVLLKAVRDDQDETVRVILEKSYRFNLPMDMVSADREELRVYALNNSQLHDSKAALVAAELGKLNVLFAIQSQCPKVIIKSVKPTHVGHDQFLQELSGRAFSDNEEMCEDNRTSILAIFKRLYLYLTEEQYGIGFGLFKSRRWRSATTKDLGDIIYYGLTKPNSRTAATLKLMIKFYQKINSDVTEQQANQEIQRDAKIEAYKRGRGLRYYLFATPPQDSTASSTALPAQTNTR